jgi:serine/threonine-protein kinase TTK/MPS1
MSPEAIIDTNVTISSSQNGEQLMKLGRPSDVRYWQQLQLMKLIIKQVWSLGCILYQMIYGKTPFAHLAMIPKIQKIIDPSYAIEFPQTIDGSPLLIDIMRSCLNRDPKRRPTIPQLIDHPFLHPDRLLNQVMNTVPQPLIEKVVHEVLRLQSQQNGPVSEESLARTIGELLNIGK